VTTFAPNLAWHPRLAEGMDRIMERQRRANIDAEGQPVNVYTDPRVAEEVARYENYRTAKAVLQSPDWYGADVIHAARDFIYEYERAVPKDPRAPIRQKCADGYNPDRMKPRDYGLAIVGAILFVMAGYLSLAVWLSQGKGM
jgi:hypothetical protein